MDSDSMKQLSKRLDALLSLTISPLKETSTDQDKIQRLDAFGYTPGEIASILGSSSDKISKQLYVIRNKNGAKK